MGELGEVSFGILKLGELGEVSFGMLKLGKSGDMSFGTSKLGKLGEMSLRMMKLGTKNILARIFKSLKSNRHPESLVGCDLHFLSCN